MKKTINAFTLAEVLITLVIIGVIASMTIPVMLNNTKQQEFRTALKKAINSLNQAVSMHYALEGMTVADYTTASDVATNIFGKRLNVIKTGAGDGYAKTADAVFYTADGVMFGIKGTRKAGCTIDGKLPCFDVIIDVNGDKRPNAQTIDVEEPLDGYQAVLYAQRAIPSDDVTQKVLYNQGVHLE